MVDNDKYECTTAETQNMLTLLDNSPDDLKSYLNSAP